jgi:hypothetical protein
MQENIIVDGEKVAITIDYRDGGIFISTIYYGRLVENFYLYYSKREAKKLFREKLENK